MAVVETQDLRKSYGSSEVLKGIDLELRESEILGVLGPNGAGKSTLVKCLTGQTSFTGDAEVLDLDPREEPVELRRRIGVLPEREDPPSFLTGEEYFDFVSDVREEEFDRDEWIEKMELEGLTDSLTRELSKGERQKLMIAQAFFHDPELVFIDEPLVNLDPVIQERVKDIFRDFRSNGGSMLLCTHIVELAEEVCDRVLIVKDGEIEEEIEDPKDLRNVFLESQ